MNYQSNPPTITLVCLWLTSLLLQHKGRDRHEVKWRETESVTDRKQLEENETTRQMDPSHSVCMPGKCTVWLFRTSAQPLFNSTGWERQDWRARDTLTTQVSRAGHHVTRVFLVYSLASILYILHNSYEDVAVEGHTHTHWLQKPSLLAHPAVN